MTENRAEHAVRNTPRPGIRVVKCPLHPGSVDVHDPAGDEEIMHVSAAVWTAFIEWVKAGLGDYDNLPDDPRKDSPRFRG
jgi:hypothetical protein